MDYDYGFYRQVITALWNAALRDSSNLEIGQDISDIPSVKIIFDGYAYNEDTNEEDNTNLEGYALFIHRDSDRPGFEFPPHETTPLGLIHRPAEEICIYLWWDVEAGELSINGLEETADCDLPRERVMTILEALYHQWFDHPDTQ